MEELKLQKLLDENIGWMLHDFGLGNDFLDMKPKAQATATTTTR